MPIHPKVTVLWHLSSMKGSRSKVNENVKIAISVEAADISAVKGPANDMLLVS